jgi:hypothetical protein
LDFQNAYFWKKFREVFQQLIRTYKEIISKKAIAIPLRAWTGPEGSRRLKLPDFKTIGT